MNSATTVDSTSHSYTPGVGSFPNRPMSSSFPTTINTSEVTEELLDALKYLNLQHKGFHEMSSDERRLYGIIRRMNPMWM